MDYLYDAINLNIMFKYYVISFMIALLTGIIAVFLNRKRILSKVQSMVLVLLIVYLFLVFASTIFCRTPKSYYSYQLIPFWSYHAILSGTTKLLWENILNIVMLLPIGLLLPILMGSKVSIDRGKNIIFTGFLISVIIEFLQLVLKRGLFEFDDIFHNTLGVAIGYGVYRGILTLGNIRCRD